MAWGMFIPLVWLLAFHWETGIWGAWVAAFIYLGGVGVVYFIRFRKGHWKEIQILVGRTRGYLGRHGGLPLRR
jgi:Na+-driven multidrug efflux pump